MTTHSELLPRYKQLRQKGLQLNNQLAKTLSRSVINEGGKKLGILEGDALTLDTEDEIAVLMDYCIHDVRRHGANAVEAYLGANPPPAGSDEAVLLPALRTSRFSLFVVETVEAGVGVHVRDLLRDDRSFLVDVGFSQSVGARMVLAMRVMTASGIGMTTGAALPLGVLLAAERARLLKELRTMFPGVDLRNPAPEEASDFAGTVLQSCLEQGAAEAIAYVKPDRGNRQARRRTKLAE